MEQQEILQQLEAYVDDILTQSDAQNPIWNIEKIHAGGINIWNYVDGCMITALLALYMQTGREKYLVFADHFMEAFVQDDGQIRTYDPLEYNIDNISPGKNLFLLYDLTGKEKYRRAMDTIYGQLEKMPRTKEGSFWHKQIYPNQVWLDGLYMAQPFYMRYTMQYRDGKDCADSLQQFAVVREHMRDSKTGLYYHGYDASRSIFWSDHETGCSQNFWLRAIGWLAAALVDTAEAMGEAAKRQALCDQLQRLMDALLPFQHKSGMFYQVVNAADVDGNYLETSGTMLIAYAALKGVRLGLLPEFYSSFAQKAFWGTCERYLRVREGGNLVLGGICLVAGLGGANKRDGSLAYYFGEPVVENEAKGIAPLVLAYTEMRYQ